MKTSKITINQINRLTEKAESGDVKASRRLDDILNRMSDNANRRMKKVPDSPAAKQAKSNLAAQNRKVFARSMKKASPKEKRDMILQARKYLSGKTSTAKGLKEYNEKLKNLIEERTWLHATEDVMRQWEIFIESQLIQEFKQFDSSRLFENFENFYEEEAGKKDLEKAFKKYQQDELDLIEAMESLEWTVL